MEWKPQDLCQCLGSQWLGLATATLCLGVCVWYGLIAARWIEAARQSSEKGRHIWTLLATVFFVSAVSGYGTMALAVFWPKVAVTIRVVMLVVQNMVCPVFILHATAHQFHAISRNEKIGDELTEAVGRKLTDRELAETARKLVSAAVERFTSSTT